MGPEEQSSFRFFRDAGYLVVRRCIADALIDASREQAIRLFAEAEPPVRTNEAGDVVRISRVFDRGGRIAEALVAPNLLDTLSCLLGPNISYVRNRHNHLTRHDPFGKAKRFHRDVLQWSRPILTVLIYLEPVLEAGSATHVIPTTHLLPTVGRYNNGGTWLDQSELYAPLSEQSVAVPVEAGDVLVLDGLVFHAMGGASSNQRLLLTAAYCSVDELMPDDPKQDRVLVAGEPLFRGDS